MEQTFRETEDKGLLNSTDTSATDNHRNQGPTNDIPISRHSIDSTQGQRSPVSHESSLFGHLFRGGGGGRRRIFLFSSTERRTQPHAFVVMSSRSMTSGHRTQGNQQVFSPYDRDERNTFDDKFANGDPAYNGPVITEIIEDDNNSNDKDEDDSRGDSYDKGKYHELKLDQDTEKCSTSGGKGMEVKNKDKETHTPSIFESNDKTRNDDLNTQTKSEYKVLGGTYITGNVYQSGMAGHWKMSDDNSSKIRNNASDSLLTSRGKKTFASKSFDSTPLLFGEIFSPEYESNESNKDRNPFSTSTNDIDDYENKDNVSQLEKKNQGYMHEYEYTSPMKTVNEKTYATLLMPKEETTPKISRKIKHNKFGNEDGGKTRLNDAESTVADIDNRDTCSPVPIQHININTDSSEAISSVSEYNASIGSLTYEHEILIDENENDELSVMSIPQNFEEWNDSYLDLCQSETEETEAFTDIVTDHMGNMIEDENMLWEYSSNSMSSECHGFESNKNPNTEPFNSSFMQHGSQQSNSRKGITANESKINNVDQQSSHKQQQQDHHGHCIGNGSRYLGGAHDGYTKRCSHGHVHMFPGDNNTSRVQCMDCGYYRYLNFHLCHHHNQGNHRHMKSSVGTDAPRRNKNASVGVNKKQHNSNNFQPDANSGYPDKSMEYSTEDTTGTTLTGGHNNDGPNYVGLGGLVESVGFTIKDVTADGNCLFASITDQLRISGDFSYTTKTLRAAAVNFLRNNPNQPDGTPLFKFLDESDGNWDQYLNRMTCDGYWGDHIVICALSQILKRRVIIYSGYSELNKTVVEPHGNLTHEKPELTNDVEDDGDKHVKEMYVGHMSQSHYVSLRPFDWKNRLLQELQSRSTSCLIGINLQSLTERKDEKEVDFPNEHFTFADKYMHMSDIIIRYTNNDSKKDAELHRYNCIAVMYHLKFDRMNAEILTNKEDATENKATVLYSTLDTIVVHSNDSAGVKDLTSDSNDCMTGYTRLSPVEPKRWLNALDDNGHLKHLRIDKRRDGEERKRSEFFSFRCEWPLEAAEWIHRQREYNWPPQDIVEYIVHSCGRIIPKSHCFSTKSDIEWKYCFLEAEKVLSESLPEAQLECFHTIKLLLDFILMETRLDISILKQPFFYMCEEVDSRLWLCDTLACIHKYLDRLVIGLRLRYVKGYFLAKENVLFDDLTEEMLNTCIERIEVLRRHTFPMLYFTFEACTRRNVPSNMLFDMLIENIQNGVEGDDYHFTLHHCFVSCVSYGIAAVWKNKQYEEAFKRCEKAVEIINHIRQTQHPVSLHDLILGVINTLNSFLDNWLFAFFVDLKIQSKYVDNICDSPSTVSLRSFFGDGLVDYIHEKNGSETIPTNLTHPSELGRTCNALLEVLSQLRIPDDIYVGVVKRCLDHIDYITNWVQHSNISQQDMKWIVYDVKHLINNVKENIKSNNKKIAKCCIAIANIQNELGNTEQSEALKREAEDILKRMDEEECK